MAMPKLTKLEVRIMEALWNGGVLSIREIQGTFPEPRRPAYTTIGIGILNAPPSLAQSQPPALVDAPLPQFEVASIKPSVRRQHHRLNPLGRI